MSNKLKKPKPKKVKPPKPKPHKFGVLVIPGNCDVRDQALVDGGQDD